MATDVASLRTVHSNSQLGNLMSTAFAEGKLRRELDALWEQRTLTGLLERAEDSLQRYPLFDSSHLDEKLDGCKSAYDQRLTEEAQETLIIDLQDLIIELEIVRVPLWASMYDEAGCRLLELLPRHADAQPDKPIGFGSRRGLSQSRRTTHHISTKITGSAAQLSSLHVDPEVSQRQVPNAAERRAVASMVKHSRRQRHRRVGGKAGAASPSAASDATTFTSSRRAGDGRQARRSMSSSRAAAASNMMDKTLYQFLQHNDLVGCEQKLKR